MIFSIEFQTCTLGIEPRKRNATAFLHRPAYQIEIEEISGLDAPVVLYAPSGKAQPGHDPVALEIRKIDDTFLQPVHVHAGLSCFNTREKIEYYLGQMLNDYNLDAYGGKLEDFIFRHTQNVATVVKATNPDEAREIVASSAEHARNILGLAASRYRLVDGVLFQEIAEPKVILDYQTPGYLRPDDGEYTARLEHRVVGPDGTVGTNDWAYAVHTYSVPDFMEFWNAGHFDDGLFFPQHRPNTGWELVDPDAFVFDGRSNYLADALRTMIGACQEGRGEAIIRPPQIKLEKTSQEFCALYFEALDLVGTHDAPKTAQAGDIKAMVEAMVSAADDDGQPFMRGNLYAAEKALERFERETPSSTAPTLAPSI